MPVLLLAWKFVLTHQAIPFVPPLPWHALALLLVLALLAAGGVHHVLGYTYRFYRVTDGPSPWIALPSLCALLVTLLVTVAAYVVLAMAPQLVTVALSTPAGRSGPGLLGEQVLAPAYSQLEVWGSADRDVDRSALRSALKAYQEGEVVEGYRARLRKAVAPGAVLDGAPAVSGDAPAAPPAEGTAAEEPPGAIAPWTDEEDGLPLVLSRELLAVGLQWLADGHRDWPPAAGDHAAFAAVPPARTASPPDGTDNPVLHDYLLSFVEEIPPDVELAREDWEQIAGARFIERVVKPMLVWQTRYLAILTLVLAAAANLVFYFLLVQFKQAITPKARRRPLPPSRQIPETT